MIYLIIYFGIGFFVALQTFEDIQTNGLIRMIFKSPLNSFIFFICMLFWFSDLEEEKLKFILRG